jgi:spermidine synthase
MFRFRVFFAEERSMEIQPSRKALLYLLFAVSGFCALVYEILWTKYLALTFGATILAVSIVAATFMGGLALGSYLIGRHADRQVNLLRLYALLEGGIAIFALLFPPTLKIVTEVHIYLEHAVSGQPTLVHLLHFLFAAVLLMPPTICMGGTFPLMCRFFARKKSGGQIGRLYALNTLGATAGAFAAGFFLIPSLGLSNTGYLAIAGNLAIAAASWLLAGKIGEAETLDVSLAKRHEQPFQASRYRLILIGTAMIGAFSLGYEILWTRVFLLFLGNTSYAFSLMLSAFLVGIALGGAFYARRVRPEINEKRLFAQLTTLMGLSVLLTAPFYDQLAHIFQFAHEASGERWWHLSLLSYIIVFDVICIPTILSGALLPVAVAILDPGKSRTGEGVGLVVLHNTVGAVLGSLLAGFVLIPAFGVLGGFRLLATLNILLGFALFFRYRQKIGSGSGVPIIATVGILLAVLPASWDPKLMNSGVYCYAPKFAQFGGLDRALSGEKILGVYEGIETTVAVKENADSSVRYFAVNGKTDGGTGHDMATQVLVGQLPLLLHRTAQEVLIIGYGSGITVGAVKEFPVARIDCAEISPEVVKASQYFVKENRNAQADPKVTLFVEDGRNLLLTRRDKYDVIVSEPSNPWQTGNSNLFTDDFYKLAAKRLKSGGIFCQWLGLYDITPDNLRIACRTLLNNFPKVLVFKVGADLVMVASDKDLTLDYGEIDRLMRAPGIAGSLAEIKVLSPADLIARYYFGSDVTLRSFSRGAPLNSDDRPILEYSAHHNLGEKMFGRMQMANTMALTQAMQQEIVPLTNLGATGGEIRATLLELGKAYYRAGSREKAAFFMQKAAEYANFADPSAQTAESDEAKKGG